MAQVSVFDVATYILQKAGDMSAMKLQKLVYYSQAWSLVWDDQPLFHEDLQAWANGPVCPALYFKHQGQFTVTAVMFASLAGSPLSFSQQDTVDAVLEGYSHHSAQWLSDQTHSEAPWLNARKGLADNARAQEPITLAAMAEYYGSL